MEFQIYIQHQADVTVGKNKGLHIVATMHTIAVLVMASNRPEVSTRDSVTTLQQVFLLLRYLCKKNLNYN